MSVYPHKWKCENNAIHYTCNNVMSTSCNSATFMGPNGGIKCSTFFHKTVHMEPIIYIGCRKRGGLALKMIHFELYLVAQTD